MTDLLGNHVQLIWGTIPPGLPHVRSGRLRGLAVGGLKRSKAIPELPTVVELGYPGYEAASWFGLLAPQGTPKHIVALLNREAVKALNAPDLNDRLSAEGAERKPRTIILDNVLFITKKEAAITQMLSTLQVEVRSDTN